MLTDPETQYQFPDFLRFLEGMRKASDSLGAEWHVDRTGRLYAVTSDEQVCCPVTLVDKHANAIETPVERVARVLKRQKPLLPPHLLDVIVRAVDNRHIQPWWVSDTRMRPAFDHDVQRELDRVAGVLNKRRHRMTPSVPQLQGAA